MRSATGIARPQRSWSKVGTPLITAPAAKAAAASSGARPRSSSGRTTKGITSVSSTPDEPTSASLVASTPSASSAPHRTRSITGGRRPAVLTWRWYGVAWPGR